MIKTADSSFSLKRMAMGLPLLASLAFNSPAFAYKVRPTHGAEFTFTNARLIRLGYKAGINTDGSKANIWARDEWARQMKNACQYRRANDPDKCTITTGTRRGYKYYKVNYPDQWAYYITVDPLVIEVQASPMTLQEAIKYKSRMEKDIFSRATKVVTDSTFRSNERDGLKPHENIGGGHIHFGLHSTFYNNGSENVLLFRNFIVDMANHPTLGMGIFGDSKKNAPPISELKKEQRAAFSNVIYRFDQAWRRGHPWSIVQLATEITNKVYYETNMKGNFFNRTAWTPPEKYQAVNLMRVISNKIPTHEKTVEVRIFRPQKSAEQFIQLTSIFDARINRLKVFNHPIPFGTKGTQSTFGSSINSQRMINEFYEFVNGAGLDWKNYISLLPNSLQNSVRSGNLRPATPNYYF